MMKVVALAGGVGGAKLAHGLTGVLAAEDLTIIVNTADDFEWFGLWVSPDLDTVCYTLAGIANPQTGWGLVDETWQVRDALLRAAADDAPRWFNVGDKDLATHLERTRLMKNGLPLSNVTASFLARHGVAYPVIPMTDQIVQTHIITDQQEEMLFQEYFVKYKCEPKVSQFVFKGVNQAQPAPGVLQAINAADQIVFCPSNPWVSLDPILLLPGISSAISTKPVVAISPIIGGKTVKGPAAKMFKEMNIEPSAYAVATHYAEILSGFVLDDVDSADLEKIHQCNIMPYITNTMMHTVADRYRLAGEVINFGSQLTRRLS